MQNQNTHKTIKLLCFMTGAFLALLFFDPFTVNSVQNVVFKGERLSQTYHLIDEVKTGAVNTSGQSEDPQN